MNHSSLVHTFGRGVRRWVVKISAAFALCASLWYGYASIPAVYWLGKSMYFEARDEGFFGWMAVANVKFNRRRDPRFPKTIKEITTDGVERGQACDFSWYCDGKPDTPQQWGNRALLQGFYILAGGFLILDEVAVLHDITKGAHSYQRNELPDDCGWFGRLEQTITIGSHTFYHDKSGKIGAVPPCK
jgi:N-acetylmuramoyl-L-alanine amidase